MTPYVTSYMRVNGVSDVSYAVNTWIISAEATGEGMAMFIGGVLERRFGPRVATFIGCFVFRYTNHPGSLHVFSGAACVLNTS